MGFKNNKTSPTQIQHIIQSKKLLKPHNSKIPRQHQTRLRCNPKSLNGYRNTSNKQHNRKLLQNNTTTKSKKNIQNTQRIKTKNKRTTNKMDPQNSTKTKHTNQHEHSIQLSKTNPTFNIHYKGNNINQAADIVDISVPSAYRWLAQWNEDGLEFLRYKNNAGRLSLLSNEDKAELKELMLNMDYLTTEKLHELILSRFEINYSYKQVRIIAHQLGFSYVKPYPEYDKTPLDAELQLKKTPKE